jgi:O-glycosyl hydrolase
MSHIERPDLGDKWALIGKKEKSSKVTTCIQYTYIHAHCHPLPGVGYNQVDLPTVWYRLVFTAEYHTNDTVVGNMLP